MKKKPLNSIEKKEIVFSFHYDSSFAQKLRSAINEERNISTQKTGELREKNGTSYLAWDRICAIMDRLEDTILHINSMTLGNCKDKRTAFDFYEFINCAYVIIDCVRNIGQIFGIDKQKFRSIEETQEVFGNVLNADGTDGTFFNYVRSVCVVHPIGTNHKRYSPYLQGSPFHCCPNVIWRHKHSSFLFDVKGDLVAYVYTSQKENPDPIRIELFVKQFEQYLKKWIDLIPEIIEAIHNYNESFFDNFRKRRVQTLSDFEGNATAYIVYLKKEYLCRFGDQCEEDFCDLLRVFSIHLSNPDNERKLQKYKNAILYALSFLRNALQNMSFEGHENTGLKESEAYSDLFSLMMLPPLRENSTGLDPYALSKVYYLTSSFYGAYDRLYVRRLLDGEKEKLNKVIFYSGNESDEEAAVLVYLAQYLCALQGNNALNKNIPNDEQFREVLLSDEELREMSTVEKTPPDIGEVDLEKILNQYSPSQDLETE